MKKRLEKNKQYLLIILMLLIVSSYAFSQTGAIRGFVYEKETGEPVIFTNVVIVGTSFGAATDVNGYYMISKVPPGDYNLQITNLGYDTLNVKITLEADDIVDKNLFLSKASYMLETVDITASKQAMRNQTHTSVVKITPKEINQIPSIGGQADLAQYLQVLPGVVFTGDQGGQLYIRGGSPIQNKVLLDGMVVYNPFHSIGLFSVFDTDILRNVEVYTGGFGAEYGGRISSIMDLTTRDGNKKRFAGKVGASTFGADVMLEGPISKQKNGSGSTSYIVSFKNSYLEESSKIFYDYVDTAGLPFNYNDFYGKLSFNASNGSKVNVFGFSFNDRVNNYKALSDFHWEAAGGGTNIIVIPGKSPMLIEGNIAYSSYKISLEEKASPPRTSQISGFNMGLNFTYFLGKNDLKYGIEMLGFKTDYFYLTATNRKMEQEENTTELSVYAKYKMTAGKFLIEPGFRIQYYASLSSFSPEPRFAMKYNATDRLRFKLAAGIYTQNLISARSDRDVVNLFYGFLSGPEDLPKEFDGERVTDKLQKAQHAIFGVEYDIFANATLNIEAYYKHFPQLTNLNRNKIFDEEDAPDQPDILVKNFIIESGDAEGIDFTFSYDKNKFFFWAVYSFAFVNRYFENTEGDLEKYSPHFDRRHNVNLLASYRFGELLKWEVNARWNYGSGFPFTKTSGFYEKLVFEDGVNTNYIIENGLLGIIYDDINTGRLPSYHRLDLSLKRTFYLSENVILGANLSITNVYDRNNIFYVDRITNERVDQLPVMPSFGLELSF